MSNEHKGHRLSYVYPASITVEASVVDGDLETNDNILDQEFAAEFDPYISCTTCNDKVVAEEVGLNEYWDVY